MVGQQSGKHQDHCQNITMAKADTIINSVTTITNRHDHSQRKLREGIPLAVVCQQPGEYQDHLQNIIITMAKASTNNNNILGPP